VIEINVSLLFQMANFLVLLLLLNIVLYRPLRGLIKHRREKMDSLAAETEQSRQRQDEINQELAENLRQAQAQGTDSRMELKAQGKDAEKELLARVHQEMEAESAQIAEQIRDQMGQARQALLGQVEAFSLAMAEKILGRSF